MENNLNRFYVYLHRRADNGKVFYVGKGCGNRAWSKKGRSKYWNRVAAKGWTHEIYKSHLHEDCAFSIEKILINHFGLKSLVNSTLGGEGASGWSPSVEQRMAASLRMKGKPMPENCRAPEARKKRDDAIRGRKQTIEHRQKISEKLKGIERGGVVHDFFHEDHGVVSTTAGVLKSRFNLDGNIHGVVNGRIRSSKGWCLFKNTGNTGHRTGNEHHNIDRNIYKFYHTIHGEVKCLRHELSKKYGIPAGRVGQVVRGEKPSCNGWRIKR